MRSVNLLLRAGFFLPTAIIQDRFAPSLTVMQAKSDRRTAKAKKLHETNEKSHFILRNKPLSLGKRFHPMFDATERKGEITDILGESVPTKYTRSMRRIERIGKA